MITQPETMLQYPGAPQHSFTLHSPDAMIGNPEQILAPDGHVTDQHAAKVIEIAPRVLWYGHDVVVLPSRPDADFLEYVNSFRLSPQVIVPSNVEISRLAMRDGMSDPEVQSALRGRWVESYIGDSALYLALDRHGIRYGGGDPGDTITATNDKGNYAELAEGLVAVPPGGLFTGIGNITRATLDRIAKEGSAFIRHTNSGGGFGNRYITAQEIQNMSPADALAYIRDKLCGSRPDLWENGSALVERALELGSSPSANFNTLDNKVVDAEQITHDSDYWGCWLPAPWWRYDRGQIQDIGQGLRERVRERGFWGRAGTDLGIASAKSMGTDKPILVGFEINGRSTAVRHVAAIAERLWGPYEDWVRKGRAVKAMDHFVLGKNYSFKDLHSELLANNLLASPQNPFGVVITIPPEHGIAGIQVLGKSYEDAERAYRVVNRLVGNAAVNTEDYPVFSDEMQRR